jgi:hypothetical protein
MSKIPRRLLRVLLILVAAVVVIGVAVRLLVPASKLAEMIADRLEAATGATVAFAGAEVDVWPRLRLVLEDGAVVGTGDALAARTGGEVDLESYAVRIGRMEVSLAWGPLLKRRLEVGEVRLVRPRIELVSRPRPAAAEGRAPAAGPAPMPMALFVAGLSIEDGQLAWRDPATGRSIDCTGWRQDVGIGDATLLLARLEAFAGKAPAPAGDSAPSRLDLRARIAELKLAGYHEAGEQVLRDLDLTGQLEIPAEADRLHFLARHVTWSGVTVTGNGAVTLSPLGDRLTGEWRLVGLDAEALRRGLPEVAPQLGPETAAWLAETPLTVGEVTASGAFDLPWPPPPGARYRDLASGLSLEAAVHDLVLVPPRQGAPWRGSATVTLRGAEAELRNARIEILDGRLDGHARFADLDRERAICSFAVEGIGVRVRSLLEPVAPVAIPYLEGMADLKLGGALTLGTPEEMRGSLELAGDLALRDGVVHAASWLEDISPYLGARQDLKDIRFRHLVQGLRVRDGKLLIENLMLDGRDTDWRGGGWLGLDGGIDMKLNVKFPEDFEPELGDLTLLADALKGDDGRIALNLHLTGRAASPRTVLDLAPAKDRLEDRIEDGVKGFLDKLRGNE